MMSQNHSTESVVLIIRDGWGENPDSSHDDYNAVKLANTPVADSLMQEYPHMLITTCGQDVGLPGKTMGNSEVGHQNIGAGRIVNQEIMRIRQAIEDGTFFDNPALLHAFEHARRYNSNVHLIGLASDALVHSDIKHLFALIELAAKEKFPTDRLFIHAMTDGRDAGPRSGLGYIQQIEDKIQEQGVGRIASVVGRFYAMDRDNRWHRVQRAYECFTGRSTRPTPANKNAAVGTPVEIRQVASAKEAIQHYYDNPTEPNRQGDEFVTATNIVDPQTQKPLTLIDDDDAVIFFNYRGDRPRELTKAFVLSDYDWRNVDSSGFDRGQKIKNLYFCTLSNYEEDLVVPAVAFDKPPKMPNILGEIVSSAGLTQFRCAETEKFAHVTFFFNDYREEPFKHERRMLCPSPKDVTTYDKKPEMSAYEICDCVVQRLNAKDCEDLIVVNFANPDMVGHTGNLEAAIKAVEVADECVGKIVDAALKCGGSLIITADHGNAEQMWEPNNNCPHTAHTTNDVPLILVSEQHRNTQLKSGGRLADIAPTILTLLNLDKPTEMTGDSLIAMAKV